MPVCFDNLGLTHLRPNATALEDCGDHGISRTVLADVPNFYQLFSDDLVGRILWQPSGPRFPFAEVDPSSGFPSSKALWQSDWRAQYAQSLSSSIESNSIRTLVMTGILRWAGGAFCWNISKRARPAQATWD